MTTSPPVAPPAYVLTVPAMRRIHVAAHHGHVITDCALCADLAARHGA